MSGYFKRCGAVVGACVGLVAMPASALAAQRYAAPGGSGTACSATAPCDVVTAVNSSSSGDEVILAGNQGSYGTQGAPITTELVPPSGNVSIHGTAGQPSPVIYSNAGLALDVVSGDSASDLTIYKLGPGTVIQSAVPVDHLIAIATDASANACSLFAGATLSNSVCDGGSEGLNAGSGCGGPCTFTDTLRNDTIVGGMQGIVDAAGPNNTEIIEATNTIVVGGSTDVVTNSSGGVAAIVNLDHSNYRTTDTSMGGTVTPPGSATNQTAAPAFVGSAAGDFHQAPGSPTIDAGVDSVLNGTTDFEGKPRMFGLHTDIGADEYAPPSVLSESASSVTTQSAVLAGSVDTEAGPASAQIDYGKTTSYGATLATTTPALSASPQNVAVTIGGLQPSTTYHYRVVVHNGSGTTAGADQTFTTAAARVPPVTPPTIATISSLTETNKVFSVGNASTPLNATTSRKRHKKGTVFSFVLDQVATVKIAVQTRVPGRRSRGRCRPRSKNLAKKPHCARTVTAAILTRAGHPGLNEVAFTGRIGRKALKTGNYQASFTALDSAGSSAPRQLKFTIVRH